MGLKIEKVTESYTLGEAPHWDIESQSLYFVDCFGKNLMKYTPSMKRVRKTSVAPKKPTFIIPVEDEKNHFITSLDKELAIVSWDGESDKSSIVEILCEIENKFDDGKCDPSGRLWAGTRESIKKGIREAPGTGALYSYDGKRQLQKHVTGLQISNGLAFNEKAKKMYHIDSVRGTIDQYDFEPVRGTITNRQVFFTLKKHNIPGFANGMTIDTDGNLWVAVFGGARILKIFGQKPEVLLEWIKLPAVQVTSLTFGGPYLNELYVTTAAFEFEDLKPSPPDNGAIYKVTGMGSKGFPGVNFKLLC